MSSKINHKPEVNLPDTPYKGLAPYSEADAPFFFGRESEWEIIADNLMAARLTLLYGDSGVGKSSLLRAGVAYHLMQDAKKNLAEYGTPEFAVVVFNAWQNDPLAGLVKQVEKDIQSLLKGKTFEPLSPSLKLYEILEKWAERLDEEEGRGGLLIILDQFEEYLLYHPNENGAGTFAIEFPLAVNRHNLPVNFLISIREDSLAKLDRFKTSIPNLFNNYLRVKHLDAKSAYDAISKPIGEYNKRSPHEEPINLQEGLVKVLINQVSKIVQGSNRLGLTEQYRVELEKQVEAPYLQLVMEYLWKEEIDNRHSDSLRLLTLLQVGGAEEIVKAHLSRQMKLLREDKDEGEASVVTVAKICQYLVTPSGSKIAYPLKDLIEPTGWSEDQLRKLLDKLASGEYRLLRPINRSSETDLERYEIFHDVLALPILEWREQYYFQEERKKRLITLKKGLPAQALSQLQCGQYEVAALLARQAYLFNKEENLEILDQVDDALRKVLSQPFSCCILQGHEGVASAVAFSPEGTLLASGSGDKWDGSVRLWNLNEPETPPKVFWGNQHNGIQCVALSRDGRYLAAGSWDDREGDKTFLRLWDLHQENPVPIVLRGHEAMVGGVAFSPEADILASASHDGTVRLWNLRQPGEVEPVDHPLLDSPENWVWSVAFSPDGKVLASAGLDKIVRLWDPYHPGTLVGEISTEHSQEIISVAFSPTKWSLLATASRDQTVRLWDLSQLDAPRRLMILAEHIECVRSVAFSPDGHLLASGSEDQTVQLYDVSHPEESIHLGNLSGHYFGVSSVAFRPKLTPTLASASWDGTVRLWDLGEPAAQSKVLGDHKAQVMSVAFSSDGKKLASGGWEKENNVKLWDLEHLDWPPKNLPNSHTDKVFAVSFFYSEDRQMQKLASGSQDKTLRVWDLQKLDAPPLVFPHPNGVSSFAFRPDGEILASGCWDNNIRLWTFGKVDPVAVFGRDEHKQSITSVVFSPDGKLLASASDDGTTGLWNVEQPDSHSSKKITRWQAHEKRVWSVAFSPNGKMLASGSDDRTIKLWDISQPKNPTLIKELLGHNFWVGSVAFSPDEKKLVSGSYDKTIRVWNLEHLDKTPIIFQGHSMSVTSVAISRDGTLASGSYDNTIRLWNLNTVDLAEVVCQKVWRNLNPAEWRQFMGDVDHKDNEGTCFPLASNK